jgi:hypothetical protein
MKNVLKSLVSSSMLAAISLAGIAGASNNALASVDSPVYSGQTFVTYIATVKPNFSVAECADAAREARIFVKEELNSVGVLVLEASNLNTQPLENLECLLSFEVEQGAEIK